MPYESEAAVVLAMWREIAQRMHTVAPESDESRQLVDDWARLRTEYERLVELASRHHRPPPERWPEG